ncbi:serine/threonine-protein kinase/endoribonuclease ire-1-like [Montipora capricornis]|uniref:serine/threonine-protein kinase/endoribonuclease ire-1-like n=1 Tax=Montipora capricornis TaxID=246305 RepID=UPI0035F1358A
MKTKRTERLNFIQSVCLVLQLFLGQTFVTGQLFDFRRSPCDSECECFSWKSMTENISTSRFTVNCTGMKFGLFQGFVIPKYLPLNTTDLVVNDYHLGSVGLNSFDNNPFPVNPMLLTLVLSRCLITFLSRETFQANSLNSLKFVDLSYNHAELIQQGTFSHLPFLEYISLSNNFLQEVQQGAFRNLPRARMINLSYNAIQEIHPGTFDRVPQLEILDLSVNGLSNLPWENLNRLTSLQVLRLEGKLKDGREAAIKKYSRVKFNGKELEILLHVSRKGSPHPNVVQYLCVENDSRFTYLALELCHGNLITVVKSEEFAVYLEPRKCFSQIASGLNHLHGIGIQHRDIKPQNILWKRTGSDLRFVISDFDLGHISGDESLHKIRHGTLGWCAPELWNLEDRTDAVDIFSLGCVFYFILTRGTRHPFGSVSDMTSCQRAIISQDYHYSLTGLQECYQESLQIAFLAEDLLRRMIILNPIERIKASGVLVHPLLWNSKQMVTFFHDIGDCIEDDKDPNIVTFKELLERRAGTVFVGSWMDQLDPPVRSDLQGYYKQREKLCALLRVLRNKIDHFGKLGNELREIYLGSREGVVEYYVNRFPNLLSYTYRTLQSSGLEYQHGIIKTKSSLK